jgi:hypothetical protein
MKNRIAQILESGNIKISSVASDLFGLSGRRILEALIEGRHKPAWMADYACTSLRKKRDQLEMALEGTLTDHQRRLLRRLVRQLQSLEAEITDLTQEIELRAAPREEMRAAPWEEMIGRLIEIPGIERVSAWTILTEIGTDMSVFPDSKHLASWAAVCPGNRESGGKRMSGKTRKGNCYLRRSLCQSAWAATRKKGSFLGTVYRRVRGRRGHQKAIMALAHRMLTIIFHMLRDDQPYREPGTAYNDEKRKAKNTARMVRGLEDMGFRVTLEVLPTRRDSDVWFTQCGVRGTRALHASPRSSLQMC